ncbi:MAG: molybdopterin-dependent oxidoreductase [Acidobacteriota bacterium]
MKIIIDDREIAVDPQKTLLETARINNIFIPSLCDHPGLQPFAGCRLCLVEIKGKKGFVPSCATFPEKGMEVKTGTVALKRIRKQILELILTEHPSACLICREKESCDEYKSTIRKVGEVTGCVLCPNNGQCELQDVVSSMKLDKVRYPSVYRNFDIRRDDPFFERNNNLCILCGRCVRVCGEIRGNSVLTFISRGPETAIGTVLDKKLLNAGCQFCGACVDVCPTGALNEKGRKFEFIPEKTGETFCRLCSMGCAMEAEIRQDRLIGFKPSKTGENKGQACVRGRFVLKEIPYASQRILKPMIRKKKELEEVSWEEAVEFVADRLNKSPGDKTACISSAHLSLESLYLFNKYAQKALKTTHMAVFGKDSPRILLENMIEEKEKSVAGLSLDELKGVGNILVFGADLPVSHPVLWVEVLKSVREGAQLGFIDFSGGFNQRWASLNIKLRPGSETAFLALLLKRLIETLRSEKREDNLEINFLKKSLASIDEQQIIENFGIAEEDILKVVDWLKEKGETVFMVGSRMTASAEAAQNMALLWNLAVISQSKLVPLALDSNSCGEWEINKEFFPKGGDFIDINRLIEEGEIEAVHTMGGFPLNSRKKVKFLVVQDCFWSETARLADAVFPASIFLEDEGTFLNGQDNLQYSEQLLEGAGETRPDWWIISKLAAKMGAEGFDFADNSSILKELKEKISAFQKISPGGLKKKKVDVLQKNSVLDNILFPLELSFPEKSLPGYPVTLLLDYSLDCYRGLLFSVESKGFSLLRSSNWIFIHPDDAGECRDGDEVTIVSPWGKIMAVVKLSPHLQQGTALMPYSLVEEKRYSAIFLLSKQPSRIIPIKIKRGTS